MATHAAPRRKTTKLLASLTLGATCAAWVAVTAATAPGPELMSGTPHAAVAAAQEVQTADAYGCYWLPDGPAWVSDRTPDGLCHDGPHGEPYGHDSPHGLRYDSLPEDDPSWDCTMDGNRVCGPNSDSRYVMSDGTPGGYWEDDHGTLLDCDDEPCVFVNGTGDRAGLLVAEYRDVVDGTTL